MQQTIRYMSTLAVLGLLVAVPGVAGDLVRVDFEDEIEHAALGGIFGEPILLGGESPDEDLFDCSGESFDILDLEDDPLVCSPDPEIYGVVQSDVSGGGRWMLSSIGGDIVNPVRTVGIGFYDTDTTTDDADCDGLAAIELGGEMGGANCSCGAPCFAQVRMTADRVFKRGAERQAFSITVLQEQSTGSGVWPPRLYINYVNPLYICQGPDKKVRWLQTESCDGTASVAEAEVEEVLGTGSTTPLGRWDLPVKMRLERVSRPSDGGGGSGGGGCNLLPSGSSCDSGTECCSGKCSGRRGAKTCR